MCVYVLLPHLSMLTPFGTYSMRARLTSHGVVMFPPPLLRVVIAFIFDLNKGTRLPHFLVVIRVEI